MKGLWIAILVVMLLFVWAKISLPLEELGTIEHIGRDGTVKSNPTAVFLMIGILSAFAAIVAVMLMKSEKKASNDVLLAPAAKIGCGTTFAWLSILATVGLLVWLFSMVGGV